MPSYDQFYLPYHALLSVPPTHSLSQTQTCPSKCYRVLCVCACACVRVLVFILFNRFDPLLLLLSYYNIYHFHSPFFWLSAAVLICTYPFTVPLSFSIIGSYPHLDSSRVESCSQVDCLSGSPVPPRFFTFTGFTANVAADNITYVSGWGETQKPAR